ncbi:hypothetical protein PF003_g40000 [Phytophthora fragariae]|nr:hypothetical protein PF003_g40000 [Phytophthora fragariae]
MSSASPPGSPSQSPPAEASADDLRRLNSLLRGRLARASADLQTAASSRNVTADDQHRLSRTLLRQTHDLRALESLYGAQQREVGRLRAEITALQEPSVARDPAVVQLESQLRQHEAEFRNLESRFDQAVFERDVLQDQSDHLAEEVRLAGDEIEQLQEDRNDLDRARENAEHELLLTETSLARAAEALQQAESRAARLTETSGAAPSDLDRLTQERDAARAAAACASDRLGAVEEDLREHQRSYRDSSAELNRLRALQEASTDDLIRTVQDRDTARDDADRLRGDVSDLITSSFPSFRSQPLLLTHRPRFPFVCLTDAKLATAKNAQGVPAKEFADAKRRLQDLEHSVRVLQRERDAARDARDQARQERDTFQRDLDLAHQKIAAVAAAVGPISIADAGASGPAAVLHSLRSTPVGPSVQDPPASPQDRAPSGPDAATSPPNSKRPRSSPASPGSSAKRRVVPLSPSDDDRGSKSSAGGSGSRPVDLTQDDGHLADDEGGSDVSDADSDAGSGSQGSVGSGGKESSDAKSSSDEEEDDDTAEVANDLLEAQTLQALAQSRSAERRRRQASPRRGPRVAGSGASPDGSDGSDSDAGSAPRSAPNADLPGGCTGFASRHPLGPQTPDPMRPVAPFGPEELCIPGRAQAHAMIQKEVGSMAGRPNLDKAMVTHVDQRVVSRSSDSSRLAVSSDRPCGSAPIHTSRLLRGSDHGGQRASPAGYPTWEVLERASGADAVSFEEGVGGRLGGRDPALPDP